MIRTDKEYKAALAQLALEQSQLQITRERLHALGLAVEQIDDAAAPFQNRVVEHQDEIALYESTKKGGLPPLVRLSDLAEKLVYVRLTLNMSREEFGKRVGLSAASVSRYEQDGYSGISFSRLVNIYECLPVRVEVRVGLVTEIQEQGFDTDGSV